MSDPLNTDPDQRLSEPARDQAILDELAELGLALARGLQERALAAEKPDKAATLVTAFQRVARTVRQSLALKGKLVRDELNLGRQMHRDADAEIAQRIGRRKAWVRLHLQRAIAEQTPEGEVDLACSRLEDLRERLDDDLLDESFLDGDLADLIAGLARALGLRPPGAPPDQGPDDEDPADEDPAEAAPAPRPKPPPEPWQANGRLAPPRDLPSWETG